MYKRFVLLLLIAFIIPMYALANVFENNNDYIKISSSFTSTSYLNKNTINVIRYDPPFYIIECDTYSYNYAYDNYRYGYNKMQFFYNYDTKTMAYKYIKESSSNDFNTIYTKNVYKVNSDVHLLKLDKPYKDLPTFAKCGDIAFYLCYGIKFINEKPIN